MESFNASLDWTRDHMITEGDIGEITQDHLNVHRLATRSRIQGTNPIANTCFRLVCQKVANQK